MLSLQQSTPVGAWVRLRLATGIADIAPKARRNAYAKWGSIYWLNEIKGLSFVMENKKDSPGVYIPPPLFYVLFFLVSVFLQKKFAINNSVFQLQATKVTGTVLLLISLFFLISSLRTFLLSKNTLVLIKPASSLQTNNIYRISRNPMYVGLAIVYAGIACFIGNWWNFILFPFLLLLIQEYIIKREEEYLERAFGTEYLAYKKRARRWL